MFEHKHTNTLDAPHVKQEIGAVVGRAMAGPLGRRRFERRVLRLLDGDNSRHIGFNSPSESLSRELAKARIAVLGDESRWSRALSQRKLRREKRVQGIRDGVFAGSALALFGIGIALEGAGVLGWGTAIGTVALGCKAIAGMISVVALLGKLAWNARHDQYLKMEKRFNSLANILRQRLSEFEKRMEEIGAARSLGNVVAGFQGNGGAYSQKAASLAGNNVAAIGYPDFFEVFEAVRDCEVDIGVVPVRNSIAGEVKDVVKLLKLPWVRVNDRVAMPIRHVLLGVSGATLETIKTVYSHYMALKQCTDFIGKHGLGAVPASDTAGAAKMVAEMGDQSIGAIASEECAGIYGLSVVARNIADEKENTTEFAVISNGGMRPQGGRIPS